MSEEQVKFEGRLAVNRRERSEVQLRLQGLVRSLRDLLDPTRPVERLEGELIGAQAVDLAQLQIKYRELLQEAEIIRQYLPGK
jgi:hypothetical protein